MALDEVLTRHGQPESFNTDQGSQFTGLAFTGCLQADGSGANGASVRQSRQRVGRSAARRMQDIELDMG